MTVLRTLLARLSPAGDKGRLSTLIFHRVVPCTDPLFPGEVDAADFDALCGWIAAWFNVLPLDEAVRRLAEGTLPSRSLSITFDDGYADNHDVALPILERHRLPATVFVATGFMDGGCMWNDIVIESIRACRAAVVDLTALRIEGLGKLALTNDGARRAAIDAILSRIKYLEPSGRLHVTEQIARVVGVEPPAGLMMTTDQVRSLRRRGLQIGAHTVSHPILATLPDIEAIAEIDGSRRWLEDVLREPVTMFAYPNGSPGKDFSERSVDLARELGFAVAVTTAPGVASAGTDPLRIPRFTPWDRNRMRFGLRLAHNLWSARTRAVAAA